MRTARVVVFALVWGLAGCASNDAAQSPTRVTTITTTTTTGVEREAFAPPSAELPLALPEGTVALEVLSWAARDTDGELGRSLGVLERRADGGMALVQESLRRQGLRLVRIGAADVGPLFEVASPVGAVRRRIVLPGVRFEEVVEGAMLDDERAVGTPLGARRVGPGEARLAVRSWSVPDQDGDVGVRADVVGVIGADMRSGRTELLSGASQETLRGTPIPGLLAHLTLRTDEAWVLVAAAPDEEWSIGDDATPAPAGTLEDPAMNGAPVRPVGPRIEPLRTSGEVLFREATGTLVLSESDAGSRLIVLLVARAPDRFTLFERTGRDQ